MVQEGRWDKCHTLHASYLRPGKDVLVVGKAVSLKEDHVVVGSNKQVVPFDYAINFSGSRYSSDIKTTNITVAHRRERFAKERENIKKCKNVVCIGGGLVGIEIACDIKDEFPDKNVTLIHRGGALMPRQKGAHPLLMDYLQNKGIKIKLYHEGRQFMLDEDDRGYFPIVRTSHDGVCAESSRVAEKTSDGGGGGGCGDMSVEDHQDDERLYVDETRVYWCTGYTPNVAHLKAGALSDKLDSAGFVLCDDYMRIKGCENIYSGGDCNASKDFCKGERTAHYAALHAVHIVQNIKRHMDGEELHTFKPNPAQASNMILLELGKADALIVIPQNYDPMISYFGENAEAVNGMLKPIEMSPGETPTRIAIVPGGGYFKSGFMDNLNGMIAGGPEGLNGFVQMELGTAGMAGVWGN
jgi:pyruvate/2-oxoglutarate dehydrogenase complex dihydrolipoamide dehydrogenase (E3) component